MAPREEGRAQECLDGVGVVAEVDHSLASWVSETLEIKLISFVDTIRSALSRSMDKMGR